VSELTVALFVGVLLGLAIGWLLGTLRVRARLESELRDSEARAAAAGAEACSVRKDLHERMQALDVLQQKLLETEGARAKAEENALSERRLNEEQRQLLDQAESKLKDAFSALSAEALKSNSDQFRQHAIEQIVNPVKESLGKIDQQVRALETARSQAYGGLTQQVQSLIDTQSALRAETANLVKALRAPSVGGRWGEVQLKRVVELAGMIERCDFYQQESVESDGGRLRPDMRVQLPGGKNIVVDAKAPLKAYLDSLEAPTEEQRLNKLKDHARHVRDHMAKLSAKAYWDHLQPTPEFVVLFLPGETFFSAALEQDPMLIEQGVNGRVILATPTTLIALLRAVAYGWRQELLADNAERISTLGRQLHERLATMVGHLARLGGSLRTSVEAFNSTIGSLESRVLPSARRFKELGVGGKQEIRELEPVDSVPRQIAGSTTEPTPASGKEPDPH